MNNRVARKLRQVARRTMRQEIAEILEQPFHIRFKVAWFILTHSKRVKKVNNANISSV